MNVPTTEDFKMVPLNWFRIEAALARHRGFNPDVPVALKKVTETV